MYMYVYIYMYICIYIYIYMNIITQKLKFQYTSLQQIIQIHIFQQIRRLCEAAYETAYSRPCDMIRLRQDRLYETFQRDG